MQETIGFLSVKRHAEYGYIGGFLVLNLHGRPLEFHCTMPVKPTRAQELLYGPTIHDFICGEQIAKALLVKAKLEPPFIFTDCEAALAISIVRPTNIMCLHPEAPTARETSSLELPKSSADLRQLSVGGHDLHVLAASQVAEKELLSLLQRLASSFELAEPFQRITEALLEAHPIAKAA
jgi:hypothetical protein